MTGKIIKGKKDKSAAKPRSVGVMPSSGGVVQKRVVDAQTKADRIIQEAGKEVERIKKQAESVLADAKIRAEAAVKKGLADGESKGLAKVTEKLVGFEDLKESFFKNAEPDVIKLSMAIAEKVIGDLAAENVEVVRGVVHRALEGTLGDRITVRVNPEDYKLLMEGDQGFKDVLDRTKRIAFRGDDSISKGGCVVESEVGTIDARLELQLEAIRKALKI